MATVPLSTLTKENSNFALLTKLLIDGGTQVLRNLFDKIHPPADLKNHLLDPGNHTILKNLLTRKILVKEQWDQLYPTGGTIVDSKNFDLTLLCSLLRSICGLKTPAAGWNTFPLPTSINQEDDIVRLRLYRNELYGHVKEPAFTEADFNNHWTNISTVLVRLEGPQYQLEVDQLRLVSMDPAESNYYFQCLEEWCKNEETIMRAIEELMNKVDEIRSAVQASGTVSIPGTSIQDAEGFSTKFKEAIQNKFHTVEDFAGISTLLQNKRLEDIFTQLVIHHTPKEKSGESKEPGVTESIFGTLVSIGLYLVVCGCAAFVIVHNIKNGKMIRNIREYKAIFKMAIKIVGKNIINQRSRMRRNSSGTTDHRAQKN